MVGFVAALRPQLDVDLFFMLPVNVCNFLIAMGIFDAAGLFLGMKMLGHAAHLGGVGFGILYGKMILAIRNQF